MTDTLAPIVAPARTATATTAPLLSVRGLRVSFPHRRALVPAVQGVSFDVHPGECVAIVGESGSGKSATARALLGVAGHRAQVAAEVMRLGDLDLTELDERGWREARGRRLALVLQDALTSLDPLRRVGAEVAEPLAVHRIGDPRTRGARVQELLTKVGVPHAEIRARQYPHELSGGLRQRALISSALAGDPSLLIADEPTTALDVTVQAQILALLKDLKDRGLGIVLISHDLAVVAALADRVLVLADGKVVEDGATPDVLSRPSHPQTVKLLDAVPGVPSRHRRTAETSVVIEARGLHKAYRSPGGNPIVALDDVSFQLHRSEILGIVGESGSGKSTAARAVLGLTDIDGGDVRILGEEWSTLPEKRRRDRRPRIQHISQDPLGSFDPRARVGAIIGEALAHVGVPRRERAAETARLLRDVGLDTETARRRPSTLSGGQRQRVAIARALATRPEVIVCDEAVSALDVSVQKQVLDLLSALREQTGVALLFISHDLGVIRQLTDRVLVMKDGAVVEQGDVDVVFAYPRHPYTRQLLASLPALPARERSERSHHAPN